MFHSRVPCTSSVLAHCLCILSHRPSSPKWHQRWTGCLRPSRPGIRTFKEVCLLLATPSALVFSLTSSIINRVKRSTAMFLMSPLNQVHRNKKSTQLKGWSVHCSAPAFIQLSNYKILVSSSNVPLDWKLHLWYRITREYFASEKSLRMSQLEKLAFCDLPIAFW